MTSGPLRIVRAGAAALLALLLGIGGHAILVGPDLGAPAPMLASVAVLGSLAWLLAGKERRLGTILALLAAGQALTHLALVVSALPGDAPGTGLPHDVAYCLLDPSALAGTGSGTARIALMVAVHALATAACGWWLRRGERWLVRRLRIVVRAVERVLDFAPSLPRLLLVEPAGARSGDAGLPWPPAAPGRGCSRRGPPALLAIRA